MLAKSVKLLLLMAAGLAAGCSTPCDAPGKLCAPISSITSAPVRAPERLPDRAPEPPPPEAQTYAVAMPDAAAAAVSGTGTGVATKPAPQAADKTTRIGLMLPLRSETLGPPADALRAGFLAAWERDRTGFAVTVIETGDTAQDVLAAYAAAQDSQDLIVGPLARSAVTAIAASPLVRKPTIALNHPEGRGEALLPPQMLVIGLSIEDEARQVAQWAAREQPNASALILSGGTPWQRRTASAFAAQWQRLGLDAKTVEMTVLNGYLSDPELVQLRARLQGEPADLLFAALDADQTRQVRVALAAPPLNDVPLYGTSSLNPGKTSMLTGPELDGVRLLDLPWQLQRDHPAVMVYPQLLPTEQRQPTADMQRLYALGIDAYRVAREIALHPASRFQLDGVTGRLQISFGQGEARFERQALPAVYKNGVPVPMPATAP